MIIRLEDWHDRNATPTHLADFEKRVRACFDAGKRVFVEFNGDLRRELELDANDEIRLKELP